MQTNKEHVINLNIYSIVTMEKWVLTAATFTTLFSALFSNSNSTWIERQYHLFNVSNKIEKTYESNLIDEVDPICWIPRIDTEKRSQALEEIMMRIQNKINIDLLSKEYRTQVYTEQILTGNFHSPFAIGSRLNFETIEAFIESEAGKYCFMYSEQYGVDPWLVIALFYQESELQHESHLPGGVSYNHYAIGIGQIESTLNGQELSAYNYQTDELDTIVISRENACDLEKNIQIAIMRLQNGLVSYQNNIFLTLQAYNYGSGLMNSVIRIFAQENNISTEEVVKDISNIGWMKYVKQIHENPTSFGVYGYHTYGDAKYIEHVLSRYYGSAVFLKDKEKEYILDLETLSLQEIEQDVDVTSLFMPLASKVKT